MKLSEITERKTTLNPPSISIGDEVKVGKFKNRKAEVKGFTKDDHGQPVLKTTKGDQKLYKPRVTKLEPVKETQKELHHCFDNSWRLMMELIKDEPNEVQDKYTLVHALVTNIQGRTFAHGWLELNGKVIDSSRSKEDPIVMPVEKFRGIMLAKNIIEYTVVEAMIKAAKSGHLGPWDESLL